jgi:hypothetical protein
MEGTLKFTVKMPRSLAQYAKEKAKESNTTENAIIVQCLEHRRLSEIAEGYKEMSAENEALAEAFLACNGNTWPSWEK